MIVTVVSLEPVVSGLRPLRVGAVVMAVQDRGVCAFGQFSLACGLVQRVGGPHVQPTGGAA